MAELHAAVGRCIKLRGSLDLEGQGGIVTVNAECGASLIVRDWNDLPTRT